MNATLERIVRRLLPGPAHYYRYHRAARQLGNAESDRARGFQRFVASGDGLACLQIGVRGKKCAPHWVSVDLFDTGPEIDHNYDVHDLPFTNESFDRVACNGILEHIPRPWVALAELRRVLRPGGEIWVELPFNQAYHAHPNDFWRVTPSGLRVWMEDFDELSCGLFLVDSCSIHSGTFFHGRKPTE